jgi:hypothetical protein
MKCPTRVVLSDAFRIVFKSSFASDQFGGLTSAPEVILVLG